MGAPVIIIERMFSGRECISALEAAAAIAFNQNQVKDKTGDGIHEAEDVQDLIKAEVNLVLQYSLDSYNRQNSTFSCLVILKLSRERNSTMYHNQLNKTQAAQARCINYREFRYCFACYDRLKDFV